MQIGWLDVHDSLLMLSRIYQARTDGSTYRLTMLIKPSKSSLTVQYQIHTTSVSADTKICMLCRRLSAQSDTISVDVYMLVTQWDTITGPLLWSNITVPDTRVMEASRTLGFPMSIIFKNATIYDVGSHSTDALLCT